VVDILLVGNFPVGQSKVFELNNTCFLGGGSDHSGRAGATEENRDSKDGVGRGRQRGGGSVGALSE